MASYKFQVGVIACLATVLCLGCSGGTFTSSEKTKDGWFELDRPYSWRKADKIVPLLEKDCTLGFVKAVSGGQAEVLVLRYPKYEFGYADSKMISELQKKSVSDKGLKYQGAGTSKKINGFPAYEVSATGKVNGKPYKSVVTTIEANDSYQILIASCPEKAFAATEKDLKQITESFRLSSGEQPERFDKGAAGKLTDSRRTIEVDRPKHWATSMRSDLKPAKDGEDGMRLIGGSLAHFEIFNISSYKAGSKGFARGFLNSVLGGMKKDIENYKRVGRIQKFKVGKYEGFYQRIDGTEDGQNFGLALYSVQVDDQLYLLSFQVEQDKFEAKKKLIEKTVKSFKVNGSNTVVKPAEQADFSK